MNAAHCLGSQLLIFILIFKLSTHRMTSVRCSTDTVYRIQEATNFLYPYLTDYAQWYVHTVCHWQHTTAHSTDSVATHHLQTPHFTWHMVCTYRPIMVTSWPPCTNPIMENKAYECLICNLGKIIQVLQLSHNWLWCWLFGRNLLSFQRNILLTLSGYTIQQVILICTAVQASKLAIQMLNS